MPVTLSGSLPNSRQPSAREAVLAAVERQLSLVSHSWPEGVQVKVRMGIHTGQAVAHIGRLAHSPGNPRMSVEG